MTTPKRSARRRGLRPRAATPRRREQRYAAGIIGAGNMATALVRGFVAAKLFTSRQIQVSDAAPAQRRAATRRLRVAATADNRAVVRATRVVILAVKPQILDAVLEEIRPEATPRHLVLSIAAGVSTQRIEARLGPGTRVVRIMPNTPALLRRGMSVVVRGRNATRADERLAVRLFRAVGAAVAVSDEGLLDAVTGLSGSGPAYVYRFAEALIDGGIAAGLPQALAYQLALQTIVGAAHMLTETGETPQALRAMVTSPGGTTVAGLTALDRREFTGTVAAAVQAATARSRELGRAS